MTIPAPSKAAIAAVLGDLRDLIINGQFIRTPDEGNCRFCDYVAACGGEANRQAAEKLPDSKLGAYPEAGRACLTRAPSTRNHAGSSVRSLLTNILLEAGAGSGKTQMLAERMAAGVAAGVYNIEHMAAVTFTRKAASELRGRFHLALEEELSKACSVSHLGSAADRNELSAFSRPFQIWSASSAGRFTHSARVSCASGQLSPGCPLASPSSTRFRILSCARRAWRDFITNGRAAGDPDMTGAVGSRYSPQDLDSAFATICANDDVDFPPGEADCP